MAQMEGLKGVLKNLDKAEKEIVKGAERGMKKAVLATSSHIKKEFRRSVTGKGFDNRTGRLRATINGKVIWKSKYVLVGYVYAGTHYAVYVEFRWSGKYAYLWPGIIEMKKEIYKLIEKETRGTFK